MRGDESDYSLELVRAATYLAVRNDFREGKRLGKPCGASHIPKAHKCTKGEGARAAKPAKRSSLYSPTDAVVGDVAAESVAASVSSVKASACCSLVEER